MKRSKWWIIGGLSAFGLMILTTGLGFITRADYIVRGVLPLLAITLIPTLIALVYFKRKDFKAYAEEKKHYDDKVKSYEASGRSTEYLRGPRKRYFWDDTFPVWLIMAGSFIVALIYTLAFHSYFVQHSYTERAVIDETTVSSYHDRTPWIVANNYASRDQGDNIGTRGDVNHVPVLNAGESSRYTTIITGKHVLGLMGYQSVLEFDLPKLGAIPNNVTNSCELPSTMNKRWNTIWFWQDLSYDLSWMHPLLHSTQSDVYGYCDSSNNPVIVMPLWKNEGFWVTTRVPAGAAVYTIDGFKVLAPSELDDIEGPTYPESLAVTERESLPALGSIGDWYSNRSGWDKTDKDAEDSNHENNSELSLVNIDGNLEYVTPLTPRGSSQSITAVIVRNARQSGDPDFMKYRVETSVDMPATSTIETSIRDASVSGDPEWTTRWAAGMRVYEIVPSKDGHWVANIGLGQAVSYRADINPDRTVIVTRVDRNTDNPNPTDPGESTQVNLDKPFSEYTDEELQDFLFEVVKEMESRR